MNDQPFGIPLRHWPPRMTPWWYQCTHSLRRRALRAQGLVHIDSQSLENLRGAIESKHGVLIAPNHSFHYDSYCLLDATKPLRIPFYIMSAWQVFALSSWFERHSMQRCGVFSVDREGTDLTALKTAIDILQNREHPLVVFPEGDIYHMNDRVTPFRDGAAAMAVMAARKSNRPVSVVPVAIKRWYVDDISDSLKQTIERIERRLFWTPRRNHSLVDRILHVAQGLLALKEIEYFGQTQIGTLPERIERLLNSLLEAAELKYQIKNRATLVPERIKQIRRVIIDLREANTTPSDEERKQWADDMDAMFLATQLYSYPGDYLSSNPTIERIAETLDKLEEDTLGVTYPTVHGNKHVAVRFDEPIVLAPGKDKKTSAAELTDLMESRVQRMLDSIPTKER